MAFDSGDRVMTTKGVGTIVYKRMLPPNYVEAATYSVLLDNKKDEPNYVGSLFIAYEVKELTDE